MNKKIIIAIMAYNEENNVVRILKEVQRQQLKYVDLKEIWLISDGSKDKTIEMAKSVKSRKVKVFGYKKNMGKIFRFNQLASKFNEDILVQIDADMSVRFPNTIERLVKPFYNNVDLAMSCAYHVALPPQTFIESLAYFGYKVWDQARFSLGDRGERYYCEGGLRAFSKKFLSVYRLPQDIPTSEDSFSYYFAKTRGFEVRAVLNSKVYFRLPDNYSDYVKQMKRFLNNPNLVEKQFGKEAIKKYNTITRNVKFKSLVKSAWKSPVTAICYLTLQFITNLAAMSYKPEAKWKVSESTKNLDFES